MRPYSATHRTASQQMQQQHMKCIHGEFILVLFTIFRGNLVDKDVLATDPEWAFFRKLVSFHGNLLYALLEWLTHIT